MDRRVSPVCRNRVILRFEFPIKSFLLILQFDVFLCDVYAQHIAQRGKLLVLRSAASQNDRTKMGKVDKSHRSCWMIIDVDFHCNSRRVSIVERLMANVVNRIIPRRKSASSNGDINSGGSRIVRFNISLTITATGSDTNVMLQLISVARCVHHPAQFSKISFRVYEFPKEYA